MPLGYDIINSIPRGFVTGLFFSSFFIVSIYNPTNIKFIFLNTVLSYIGYLVNPNSVLVSAPFLCFMFFHNYKNKRYYFVSIIAVLFVLPVHYYVIHYYKIHPEYVLYGFSNSFSFNYFKTAIIGLNERFAHVSFFIDDNGFFIQLLLLFLGFAFYKKNKVVFLSYGCLLIIVVVSLFSSKAADGAPWAFYSYSRLYLGIPVFLYLFLPVLNVKKAIPFIIVTTLFFSVYKNIVFNESLSNHRNEKKWDHLNLISLHDLKNHINIYKLFAKKYNANAIIIDHVWRDDFINYAGSVLYSDYPQTFKPSFERRTWLIEKEKTTIYTNIILLLVDTHFDETIKKQGISIDVCKLDDYGAFVIKNNTLTTHQLLKSINYTIQVGS